MEAPYKPIDCLYYDRLEAWATMREDCTIIWMDEDKKRRQTQSKIIDLRIQDHAEYLVVEKGLEIRLDKILSINAIPVPGRVCNISEQTKE